MDDRTASSQEPTHAWRVVRVNNYTFYVHRHRTDRHICFAAYEPSTLTGPHSSIVQHPTYGFIGRLGSQKGPALAPTDQPPTSEEWEVHLTAVEAFRQPQRELARRVLHAGVPELEGIPVNLDCRIEIILH